MGKQTEIQKLAEKLAQLVEFIRKGKPARNFQWWQNMSNLFKPCYGYQEGQAIFEAVIQGISNLNPEMLSEEYIRRQLIYEFLQHQNIDSLENQWLHSEQLIKEAKEHVSRLVAFKAKHDVYIPITNLWHRGKPVNFFGITFIEFTRELSDKWKEKLNALWSEQANTSVHTLAKINVTGDEPRARTQALTIIRDSLDIFRALCFPFGKYSSSWQVGIPGDILSYHNIPMSIDNSHFFSYHNIGNVQLKLDKHIIDKYNPRMWSLIYNITINDRKPKRLCDSIRWLAEATKPDTNNAKLIKVSIALETLLGKEATHEELKVRGITAMLAERAAFIAGNDCDDMIDIDRKTRDSYGKRSKIVHGQGKEVSSDDIDEFGILVRRIVCSIIEEENIKNNLIENPNKLESWIKIPKYTLPNKQEASHAPGYS